MRNNQLSTTVRFNPNEILILIENNVFHVERWCKKEINEYIIREGREPKFYDENYTIFSDCLNGWQNYMRNEKVLLYFSKFINQYTENNPKRDYFNLIEKYKIDDKILSRFVEEKTEDILFNFSYGERLFENKYLIIREPLLSYIEQKFGVSNELIEFKKLFLKTNSTVKTFEEYLEKKPKELMDIDLDGYLDTIKNEQEISLRNQRKKLGISQKSWMEV